LAAQDPVTISDDRATVAIRLKGGEVLTQRIQPTPRASLEKLCVGLTEILSHLPRWQNVNGREIKRTDYDEDTNVVSFASPDWQLDPEGDAIHKHLAFGQANDLRDLEAVIRIMAKSLNHDPHITFRAVENDGGNHFVTVTCTTHSPRGLSVRDIRLAKEINGYLFSKEVPFGMNVESVEPTEQLRHILNKVRELNIATNREKINHAMRVCGCADAKAT
jgi:pterin-4a-carbinolamine dehydratase